MSTPELVVTILTTLGAGGILKTIVDAWLAGWKDARKARGVDTDRATQAEARAAYYADQLQATRERALAAGMTPEDLGPPPHWPPSIEPKG